MKVPHGVADERENREMETDVCEEINLWIHADCELYTCRGLHPAGHDSLVERYLDELLSPSCGSHIA